MWKYAVIGIYSYICIAFILFLPVLKKYNMLQIWMSTEVGKHNLIIGHPIQELFKNQKNIEILNSKEN